MSSIRFVVMLTLIALAFATGARAQAVYEVRANGPTYSGPCPTAIDVTSTLAGFGSFQYTVFYTDINDTVGTWSVDLGFDPNVHGIKHPVVIHATRRFEHSTKGRIRTIIKDLHGVEVRRSDYSSFEVECNGISLDTTAMQNSGYLQVRSAPAPHGGTGANAAYAAGAQNAICAILPGCKPPDPVVQGFFPGSFLTPGGYVLIFGTHFNSLSGPGGKLQYRLDGIVRDLVDLAWNDTSVGGRVPDGWNWNSAPEVEMWLTRSDGTRSNSIRMNFTPTYEVQVLPAGEIRAECGGGDHNYCPNSNDIGATIDTFHTTVYGQDWGTDRYTTSPFRNGWALYDYDFHSKNLLHGTVDPPSGFRNGYNYLDLQVHWGEDGGSILFSHSARTAYDITVYIRGPKGYSWQ